MEKVARIPSKAGESLRGLKSAIKLKP